MRFLIFLFFTFSAFGSTMDENLTSDYNATSIANILNISYQDFNFLSGLTGLIVGCMFGYGLIVSVLNISRGR
jgi:hypothetical protein